MCLIHLNSGSRLSPARESAEFVTGAEFCEPWGADFVAGATIYEP